MNKIDFSLNILRDGTYFKKAAYPENSPPQIDFKAKSKIKASMKAVIFPDEEINLLTDELQPMIFTDTGWKSLGIYIPATVQSKGDGFSEQIILTAYDRGYLLREKRLEKSLFLAAGTNYIAEIETLLNDVGIVFPIKTASTAVLPTSREWEVGENYLDIINELLTEIGYREISFDADGHAHLEPYQAPDNSRVNQTYSDSDLKKEPVTENWTSGYDYWDAPNVFICTCSSPDLDVTLTATAVNDNALSAKSTVRRNMRICAVESVNDVADQTALELYAYRRMVESQLSERTVTFYTLPEAGHGLGFIVALDHKNLAGVYEETSWSLKLEAGGLMKHTAEGVVM